MPAVVVESQSAPLPTVDPLKNVKMSAPAAATTSALVAPPHPTPEQIEASARRYFLFGYPISHSASPAFQNLILQSIDPIAWPGSSAQTFYPSYNLKDTKAIDEPHFKQMVRTDPLFAGAGVTMPLKVAVAAQLGPEHILDELSEAGKATRTVNTIISVPDKGKRRMIGTNTDYLGIAHAVLRGMAVSNNEPRITQYLDPQLGYDARYVFPRNAQGKRYSAFIIGSGGTCRSAVYAVSQLNLSPIYLLNRDAEETQAVLDHFGDSLDLRPLRSVEAFEREQELRNSGEIGHVACAVGAIPAFAPQTEDEKMVYTLAHRFFDEPYHALTESHTEPETLSSSSSSTQKLVSLPLPPKRPFLDMCYKPRMTPLLIAASEKGWQDIGGVEAMVEQGLAQARMWAASAKAMRDGLESFDPIPFAVKAGDDGPIGLEVEENARKLVNSMMDIVASK
ncbi:NAD(P)-binding protein [Testicularia cyperi]|uniref:NAD(P)-binding protein n=1 Tax=Testicularia cyperi TaxID=1882483 RepID=A0A317Y086_9BASI|nr:NAD(P)-binding protein [Testicularia cyperi]